MRALLLLVGAALGAGALGAQEQRQRPTPPQRFFDWTDLRFAPEEYRRRRDELVSVLAARVPSLRPVGLAAGLHFALWLPPGGPSEDEVVARAAEPVDWAEVEEYVTDPEGDRRKHKRISIFFESFVINRDQGPRATVAAARDLQAQNETLTEQVQALIADNEALKAQMVRLMELIEAQQADVAVLKSEARGRDGASKKVGNR